MIELLENEARRAAMGLEGRKRLERDHHPDVVADRFQDLYQRLAESAPA
jgi:glycosyltransferase involved in cell wall biosynthesis